MSQQSLVTTSLTQRLFLLILIFFIACVNCDMPINDLSLVQKINVNQVGWKATIYHQFDHLTFESASSMLGANLELNNFEFPYKVFSRKMSLVKIANEFDSRSAWPKCKFEIRNQGKCGACWAFSSSEVLSDRLCIASNASVNVILSPQYMMECSRKNNQCQGGTASATWEFLSLIGTTTESCIPYQNQDNTLVPACQYKCKDGSPLRFYKAKKNSAYRLKTVIDIQREIEMNGPVQTTFSLYLDLYLYRSGVYRHVVGNFISYHAVKIVGWGIDSETNLPYWIVANSWGADWGLNGYFWILRGKNECGIEETVWTASPEL